MKKNKILFLALACIGFLFLALGGALLILGTFLDNTVSIYVALGLILGAICFYVILGIVLLIIYLKRR